MKIGLFTETYYPHITGVAVSVEQFYKALKKLGHKVYLVAPAVKDYHDNDPDIIRLPSIKMWPGLPDQVRIPFFLKTQQFTNTAKITMDIIHAHAGGFLSLWAYLIAKEKRIPYLITYHTDWSKYTHYFLKGKVLTPEVIDLISKWFLNKSDAIIAPSTKIKKMLESIGVIKPIYVIPSFIDIERFSNIAKGFLYALCNFSGNERVILSIGRFGKEKSFDFIISSLAPLLVSDKNLHLTLVGLGPEKNNLIKIAKKLGIEDKVHLVGPVEYTNIPKVYADAEIFVFASTTETQGLVLLEAAASGLPLVIVNDQAYEDIVHDGINGFKSSFNQREFRSKVERILGDDKLRMRMGQESLRIIDECFNKKKIMDELIKVYHHLMGSRES